MACATSCKTQDHRSYGECLRSKGLSTLAGETTKASGPTQRNDALTAKAAPLRHNHVTRDIKAPGQCPACDRYYHGQSEGACKIRGPYLPLGDIDWNCRTHQVDCVDATDGAIVCPVTGRDRAGQVHPLTAHSV